MLPGADGEGKARSKKKAPVTGVTGARRSWNPTALDVPGNGLFDLVLRDGADELVGNLSTLENQQRGDAANLVGESRVRALVNVQLDDLQFAGIFLRDLIHRGRQDAAGPAPLGPKVDHHRLRFAGFKHLRLKIRVVHNSNILTHLAPFSCGKSALSATY